MLRKALPTYWHRSVNFGDCIAPYLLKKMGHIPIYVSNEEQIEHLALIGSLLDTAPLNNTHVWGCGFAYENSPVYEPKKIYAVRGKLSRQKYLDAGIACPEVYGDPALLLPEFYYPEDIPQKYRLGIIPHVVDYVEVLKYYANKYDDTLIIDLSQPVETVIDQILSCEMTISSSLHGLIVSHAYGIPTIWGQFSDKVLGEGFKFRDYYSIFDGIGWGVLPHTLRDFPNLLEFISDLSPLEAEPLPDLTPLINSAPFKIKI